MDVINTIHVMAEKTTRLTMMPVKAGILSVLCVLIFMLSLSTAERAAAQDKKQVVRIAKLLIDSAQLENYMTALKEHAETAVRVEPGVLTLYAVADKNVPTRITVFEIYADEAAYQTHLQTAHFKKYKSTTKDMVKSLELVETTPIVLAAKPRL